MMRAVSLLLPHPLSGHGRCSVIKWSNNACKALSAGESKQVASLSAEQATLCKLETKIDGYVLFKFEYIILGSNFRTAFNISNINVMRDHLLLSVDIEFEKLNTCSSYIIADTDKKGKNVDLYSAFHVLHTSNALSSLN